MKTRKIVKTMPQNAKKVFQGVIFDIYQWKQKLFDGSQTIFERADRPNTVEIIGVTPEKKIIVIEQKQPDSAWFWDLPGGRIDSGESFKHGAARELLEETGYISDKIKLWREREVTSKLDWIIYECIAYGCKKKFGKNLEAGEKIKVHLLSFEEFLMLPWKKNFYCTHLSLELLKMQIKPKLKQDFYNLLFKKNI
ncbi:MAG: NUDIX hydrolase [Patescibacteria group bacterium]|jgi:ADP-ribose pyrophosphatase